MANWEADFERELAHARSSRLEGNEGRARVCARRAAGIAAGEYLFRLGFVKIPDSAYDRLEHLARLPQTSSKVSVILKHLLMTVSNDHSLPLTIDLVAEAGELIFALGLEDHNH